MRIKITRIKSYFALTRDIKIGDEFNVDWISTYDTTPGGRRTCYLITSDTGVPYTVYATECTEIK